MAQNKAEIMAIGGLAAIAAVIAIIGANTLMVDAAIALFAVMSYFVIGRHHFLRGRALKVNPQLAHKIELVAIASILIAVMFGLSFYSTLLVTLKEGKFVKVSESFSANFSEGTHTMPLKIESGLTNESFLLRKLSLSGKSVGRFKVWLDTPYGRLLILKSPETSLVTGHAVADETGVTAFPLPQGEVPPEAPSGESQTDALETITDAIEQIVSDQPDQLQTEPEVPMDEQAGDAEDIAQPPAEVPAEQPEVPAAQPGENVTEPSVDQNQTVEQPQNESQLEFTNETVEGGVEQAPEPPFEVSQVPAEQPISEPNLTEIPQPEPEPLPEEEGFVFRNFCQETCFIEQSLDSDAYDLIIEVESGTLWLEGIEYLLEPIEAQQSFIIEDRGGGKVKAIVKASMNGALVAEIRQLSELVAGTYDIEIVFDDAKPAKIYLKGAQIAEGATTLLRLDRGFAGTESFAVETSVAVQSVTVEGAAESLSYCDQWRFGDRTCAGPVLALGSGRYSHAFQSPSFAIITTSSSNFTKLKDDPNFDLVVDSTNQTDGTLTVRFHHTSLQSQPIVIDGDVEYQLSHSTLGPSEVATLSVFNYSDQYFRIKVGEQSEVLAFGTAREFDVNISVKDSTGADVALSAELVDELTGNVVANSAKNKIKEGKHKLRISPTNGPVKNIEFNSIDVNQNITSNIGFEDTPEFGDYVEVYAIDPTMLTFTDATVTATAKGNALYKCKDWNFAEQTCYGEWVKLMDITPGQEYSFTLTPEDPGFAELTVQTCSAEDDSSGSGLWDTICDNSYPGTALFYDDANYETHTIKKAGSNLRWGGLRIASYDASVTNCLSISSVYFCYKWWADSAHTTSCDISVDANGGASYTAVTTSCPTTSEPASVTCMNVTTLESWTCNNFFTGTGALAKSEVLHSTATGNDQHTITWDVFYFNVTYTTDNAPIATLVSPAGGNVTTLQNVDFTCNATDDVKLTNITFYWNYSGTWQSNGTTVVSGLSNSTTFQRTSLSNGAIAWNCYACDNASQCAFDATNRTVVVNYTSSESTAPTYSSIVVSPTSPATYAAGQTYTFNATWTDDVNVSTVLLEFNDANYTATRIGATNVWQKNLTNLAAAAYNYKWYANDTSNNWNSTTNQTYTVNKATTALTLTISPSSTVTYGTQTTVNCSSNTAQVTPQLYRNGTLVSIPDVQTLGGGTYGYTCNATATENYTATTTSSTLTVNKQTTAVDLFLNGTQANLTVTYSASTSATTVGYNGTVTLYRNGTPVSNPDLQTLGAGTYNYTATIADDQNRTGSSKTFILTVNKQPTAIDLFLNGAQANLSINYGATSNATAVGYNDTPMLYRNGVPVSNPQITTLAAGVYNYTASIADDADHIGSTKTYFVTVGKIASNVNLVLNGINSNLTIEVYSNVNHTATRTAGETDIQIYKNGTLIANGASPLTNVTNYTTLGFYNITVVHAATENYTASSATHFLTVRDSTSPTVTPSAPADGTNKTTPAVNFTFTATDNFYTALNCTLYMNGAVEATNASTQAGVATTFARTLADGNKTWYVRCTDGSINTGQSSSRTLTVDTTPPTVALVRPIEGDIVGFVVTLDADIADATTGVSSASYVIKSGGSTVASGSLTAPNYQATWNSSSVADGDYTFNVTATDALGNTASNLSNFKVDNTKPFVQIISPTTNGYYNANFNLNITYQNTKLDYVSYNITNTSGAAVQSNLADINQATYAFTDTVNASTLPNGNYTVNAYARDVPGYTDTVQRTFYIDKTAPSYSNIVASPTSPATYNPSGMYTFNATWTDNYGVTSVTLEFDGVNYTDATQNGSVYSKTFTNLGAGAHGYKWYASDAAGNTNATTTQSYTVDKASTTTHLYLNGQENDIAVTYPTQTNATATTDVLSVALTRNGVPVSNSDVQTLAAGTYVYNATNAGNTNYTGSSVQKTLTVNKGTTGLTLNIQPSSTVTYGTETNVQCSANNSEVTPQLYRNGVLVSSPNIATLAADIYNYTCNATATQNYTAASTSSLLTVNKAVSSVTIKLNGVDGDQTAEVYTNVNQTTTRTAGETDIQIYRNGSQIASGASPLTQMTNYTALGMYNITAVHAASENYTASSASHILTVRDLTNPTVTPSAPAGGANSTSSNVNFVFTATDNFYTTLSCELYVNGESVATNSSVQAGISTTFAKTLADGNKTWYVKCTDGSNNIGQSSSRTLTVDTQAPIVALARPLEGDIVGYTVTLDADVTDETTGVATVSYTIKNSTGSTVASGLLTAPNYQANWNSSSVTDGNYVFNATATDALGNSASNASNFIVDNTKPSVQIVNPQSSSHHRTNFDLNITYQNTRLDFVSYNITNSTGAVVQQNSADINQAAYAFTDAVNVAALADGTYTIYAYARDVPGSTDTANRTFFIDKTAPQYSNLAESPSDPATYSPSGTYVLNATWTDTHDIAVTLEFDGANYTDLTNVGNVYSRTFTDLAAGSYNYMWYAADEASNEAATSTQTYTINKAAAEANLLVDGIDGNIISERLNSVDISGTLVTPASGSVTITENGTQIASGASPQTANRNYTTPGVRTIMVSYAGNQNYTSANETHTVTVQDTTVPATVSGLSETAVGSDHITWSWMNPTNDDFSHTEVYIDGVFQTNTSSATYDATSLDDGVSYNISLRTADIYGNVNPTYVTDSATTLDATLPTIANLTEPTDPSTYSPSANYAFTADVTDNVAVGTVVFEFNGANYTTSKSGSVYNLTLGPLAVGTYNYKWYADDATGNLQSSSLQTFTVSKAASAVGLTLNGQNDNIIVEVNSNVTHAATRTVGEGGLEIYRNGELIAFGATPLSQVTNYSWALSSFNITAAYPETQNYTSSLKTWFVTVQDTTNPTVTLSAPADDTNSSSASQTFTFSVMDNFYTTLNCTLYVNDAVKANNASTQTGVSTAFAVTLTEGAKNWYVKCTDGSLNSADSDTRSLDIDLTAPTITHVRPVQSEIVGYTVTLDIDTDDAFLGIDKAVYTIKSANNTVAASGTLAAPNYQANWNSATVADGTYTFTATVNDTVSNTNTSSVTFTVDNTKPFIQIVAPAPGYYKSNFNLNITYQNTRLDYVSYNITNSTGAIVQQNSADINQATYAFTDAVNVAALPNGNHTISAYARDTVGSTDTAQLWFVVDKTAPSFSIITEPSDPATYLPSGNYQFNATVTDNYGTNSVTLEFNGVNYTDLTNVGNIYSKTLSALDAGTYNYRWYATDVAGNANATPAQTYTINKAASAVSLLLDGISANKTAEIPQIVNITASRITGESDIELYRQNVLVASGAAQLTSFEYFSAEGVFNITAVYPESTNYLRSSATYFVIARDTTAPTVTSLGPANNAIDADGAVTFQYSVSDMGSDIANCKLYINGVLNETDASITEGETQSFTKYFNPSGVRTWRVDCTDSSANANVGQSATRTLTIDLPQGVDVLAITNKDTNRTIVTTYTITITNTGDETDNLTLSLNNIDGASTALLNQTAITNLASGQAVNVTLSVADDDTVGAYRVNVTATSSLDPTVSDRITVTTAVYGKLTTALTAPTDRPIIDEGLNITMKGRVTDEFDAAISGAAVTFEPINDNLTYMCSASLEEGSGIYNCTKDTSGMAATLYYDVRVNATKQYYHAGTSMTANVFTLGANKAADLLLQKIADAVSIAPSQIVYNVTLMLTNAKGTSTATSIIDADSTNHTIGTIGAQTVVRNYTLTYPRGSNDQILQLASATATGYDPTYLTALSAISNAPVIVVPQSTTNAMLTIIKNVIYLNQTETSITYKLVDEVMNSGGQDVTAITFADSDIDTSAIIPSLARGASQRFEGNVTLSKTSQNLEHTFAKAIASANATIFESNQPEVLLPGYGGPFDVTIKSLPSAVTTGSGITGTVELINQNPDVADDRVLITQIKDASGTIYDEDIRTVYVGRNSSAVFAVSLNAPASPGAYAFFTKVVWPASGQANASKTFDVTQPLGAGQGGQAGATGGGGGSGFTPLAPATQYAPSCGDGTCLSTELATERYSCVADCGYDCSGDGIKESWTTCPIFVSNVLTTVPQDLIKDIVFLRNKINELTERAANLRAQGIETASIDTLAKGLEKLINEAELKAAQGDIEAARNMVRTAFGRLGTILIVPLAVEHPTGNIVISPDIGAGLLGGVLGMAGLYAGARLLRRRKSAANFTGIERRIEDVHEERREREEEQKSRQLEEQEKEAETEEERKREEKQEELARRENERALEEERKRVEEAETDVLVEEVEKEKQRQQPWENEYKKWDELASEKRKKKSDNNTRT